MTIEFQARVVVVGNRNVGKTDLIQCSIGQNPLVSYTPTNQINGAYIESPLENNKKAGLSLCDMPGGLQPDQNKQLMFQQAQGFVIVCDLTNKKSFDNVPKYIAQVWNNSPLGYGVPIILVGTKSELKDQRQVSSEELKKCAKTYRCSEVVEVSSHQEKTGVKRIFDSMAEAIYQEGKLRKNLAEIEKKRVAYLDSPRGKVRAYAHYLHLIEIWNRDPKLDQKSRIIALLNDYVAPKSFFNFFTQFSRNHIDAVREIIKDEKSLTLDGIRNELNRIPLENVEGTLSHIIDFIDNPYRFNFDVDAYDKSVYEYRAMGGGFR